MFYVKQAHRHTGINRVQKQSRARKTLTSRTSCLSIYTAVPKKQSSVNTNSQTS